MNYLVAILTRLPRRSSETACAVTVFFLLSLASIGRADVGGDNPTGPAGIFNGETLGYDPYTGNVKRSVVDLSVAGAVSPLALARIYNSRDPTGSHFGANGWRHSYEWTIDPSGNLPGQTFPPVAYVVNFPDGRRETFRFVSWDCAPDPPYTCYYRVVGSQGGSSSAGVRERFQQIDMGTLVGYLKLADGSKVKFQAARHNAGNGNYYYTYQATAIVDPYGLETTISYDGYGRISYVTEPAGRSIQFSYWTSPANSQRIDHITGSDGRSVYYYYITSAYPPGTTQYVELNQVAYFNQWNALYKYCAPNANGVNGIPLLFTADDPMYPGSMKRIAYEYKTGTNPDQTPAVYGQIYKVRYWDGTTQNAGTGVPVSTLDVTGATSRKETRGDSKWRTFAYGATNTNLTGHLLSCTDFMNHISASQTYDANNYINSVTDRNNHRTDFANNALNGNTWFIGYPLTPDDTPGQTQQPVTQISYAWSGCADPNNRDATNPYYVCATADEGGNVTQVWRDTNKRITRIDYPDGGYETFSYDANHFYQLLSHRMKTGGTESFTYNGPGGLKDTYRNPDNPTGNPTVRYYYDALGRVSGVLDALSHPTNYLYNDRGQLTTTTLATDPVDNQRHTIVNAYNPDGTLQTKTDELSQVTSYIYDDYRRLKSVTPPARGDGTGTHTTNFYYGANAWNGANDYQLTDSNATWIVLPSGKKTNTVYDDNRRKQSVTVAFGTADVAVTGYTYDNVGNVTVVTNPRNFNTTTFYDARNRPKEIRDCFWQPTTITYDIAGHQKTITRPNGQVITYAAFDSMNRVLSQKASNHYPWGDYDMWTGYTYYTPADGPNAPVGLLHYFQDSFLFGGNDQYIYGYDSMGRKTSVTYPLNANSVHRTEGFGYDTVGRLQTFTNRAGSVQTFSFDALNRTTGFTWNDGTPSVSLGYDIGSRLITINNANASISRVYWSDNSLRSETETATGGTARAVSYFYDSDGNRAGDATHPGLQIPGYSFTYTYTNRNQLRQIKTGNTALATFTYDENGYTGDLTTRSLANGTSTSYQIYDAMDRVTWMNHSFGGNVTRTFNYGYDLPSGNRKFVRRLGSSLGDVGDAYGYDLADQAIALQVNVPTPQNANLGFSDENIYYDANGNLNWFSPPGWGYHYTDTDNLNQYVHRTVNNITTTAIYDPKGNMTTAFDGSTYQYDAQNRLTRATKNGVPIDFAYDGLNRQVKRIVTGGTNPGTFFSVWDGWDLVSEYHMKAGTVVEDASYLHGPTGLVKNLKTNNYYYQDASGSTSNLADSGGTLKEWYRYDLQGTPFFYDANNNQTTTSSFGVRHLFTGQQWYSEVGLYDLRNRFYSPDIGRFLQPDPIGFNGDAKNLYRYCGNNPVTRFDPNGTQQQNLKADQGGTRGDMLDYGYWGGDGTATVSFDTRGYDWSGNELGMLQTEQYYASAPYGTSYTQAMGINGWGSMGGIIFPQHILKATDAHTGLYADGSAPGAASFGAIGGPIGVVADIIGKIWNIPNDIIGLALGVAGLPFGAEMHLGNNALEFTNNPLAFLGAITLGNVINYAPGFGPTVEAPEGGHTVGTHESMHTFQGQILGPLYIPANIIGGILGSIFGGDYHAPGNFMEAGPQSHPSVPFIFPGGG